MSPAVLADLIRDLAVRKEVGGYETFVVADEHGGRFEVLDIECPGNGLPLVIRIGDPR